MVRRRGPRLTAAQKAELWRRWRQGESLTAIGRALGRIPKMVHFGNEVRVRANASDPDDDPLTFRWSASTGRFVGSTLQATARWEAPEREGSVPINVRVTDGQGGSVSGSAIVRVNRPSTPDHPPVREYSNCTAMRAGGWNKGVNRSGGTYRNSWDDAERRTYNLNTKSDRDKDGHACE